MKISHIFYLGLVVAASASCSQDLEIEEYNEGIGEIVPFKLNFKFAEDMSASSRRKTHYGGHVDKFAYYKWDNNDLIGVQCPDAPEGYKQGVYKITKYTDYPGSSAATEELMSVNGQIGYEKGKEDELFRVFYGCPASKVQITNYGEMDEKLETLTGSFTVTIEPTQNGKIEEKDENGTKCYYVGDWQQAIFAGAKITTPAFSQFGDWFQVYPVFTTAAFNLEVTGNDYTIEEITLTGTPYIGGTPTPISICGTANGEFECEAGGMMNIKTLTTTTTTTTLTLKVGENGQTINAGEKLCASMFFFPCGPSGTIGVTDTYNMDLEIGVKYSHNGTSQTKTIKLEKKPVKLRGYNEITLPKLS